MKATHALHRSNLMWPNCTATIMGDRVKTWHEVSERVGKLAGGLRNLNVKENDRVAILALNSDRYYEYYFGVWWAGAVAVPMNVRWSGRESTFILNDCDARVLFIDTNHVHLLDDIRLGAANLEYVVFIDDGPVPDGCIGYETFLADSSWIADRCGENEAMAAIFYTGGSTGFPKGAVLSHRSIVCNGLFAAKAYRMDQEDHLCHATPMFHLSDGTVNFAANSVGMVHSFIPSFTAGVMLDALDRYQPTHILLVPTMLRMLLENEAFSPETISCLKYMIYGASPMPEGLLKETLHLLPDLKLIQGYGQTELGPLITVLGPEYHVLDGKPDKKFKSAGQPVVSVSVRISDNNGNTLPPGKVGQIAVSSPGAMSGYWKRPEETAAVMKNGEIFTGDAGYMDKDGFVYIVDRLKDMIITGGENIFSAEVENVISMYPGVSKVAVIGVPDKKWGEAVHAIVIPESGKDLCEQEIINFCKKSIAGYKVPRSVAFRTDPFPLSGTGKVLKKDLRSVYWRGREKNVS